MKILAIETSCDETAAAIVEKRDNGEMVSLLSNSLSSSLTLHAATGGIIPEVAAREQSTYIIPVIEEALQNAHLSFNKNTSPDIDAIAVTYGPGLIGSLLVGVETAKTLSFLWGKPLIPVNHLFGHIYANWLHAPLSNVESSIVSRKSRQSETITTMNAPQFPLVALIVSGGHTDLVLMKSHTDITWLGGTRDDAAGECFDKSGRLLGLSYPAGPEIEQRAKMGNPKAYHFPRPLLYDNAYDFSFSGLKTAILREVQKIKKVNEQTSNNICRGLQDAIIDVLITKTLRAADEFGVQSILLSGGVAANQTLRETLEKKLIDEKRAIQLFAPPKQLCTDNAAMIGAAALFRNQTESFQHVTANPELYFD